MRELGPAGVQQGKAHRLKRKTYQNPGPNHSWHCNGYDKLKPYGFLIHGCIDSSIRNIIWLYVTRANNFPSNVAVYYLKAAEEFKGCPIDLVADLGTENGLMAGIHAFFEIIQIAIEMCHLAGIRESRVGGHFFVGATSHGG